MPETQSGGTVCRSVGLAVCWANREARNVARLMYRMTSHDWFVT